MSYSKRSHLIAALLAASSLAAQAHPANDGLETGVSDVSTGARAAALSGQAASPSPGPVVVGNSSPDARGVDVKLVAVSSSNELLGAVKAGKSNLGIQQTELNGWILVLIGGFLIWTMSQRRIRSMLD